MDHDKKQQTGDEAADRAIAGPGITGNRVPTLAELGYTEQQIADIQAMMAASPGLVTIGAIRGSAMATTLQTVLAKHGDGKTDKPA
jgi:Holliday junction resolvasome RuvABC DNA-binding subunit